MGRSIRSFSALTKSFPFHFRVLFQTLSPFTKTLPQAAATVAFAACSPDVETQSGAYFNNCFPCAPAEGVADRATRAEAWQATEEVLRVKLAKGIDAGFEKL